MDDQGSGVFNRGELYLGSRHLATYTSGQSGATFFTHADWLGTERARTDVSGAVAETCTSLPFGDAQTCSSTDISPMHFTGDERDSETSLDHTWFRQYSSQFARWTVPDPAGLAAVDPSNPQSWNRNAYVGDDPMNFVDPFGSFTQGPCNYRKRGCPGGPANGGPPSDPIDPPPGNSGFGPSSGGNSGQGGGGGNNGGGNTSGTTSSRIQCATQFGRNHSLAAGVGAVFGDKVGNNFVTQLFLGNTVSSIFKLGTDIFDGTTPTGNQIASSYLKGVAQGVPIPGASLPVSGPAGPIRDALAGPALAAAYNTAVGAGSQTLELGISASKVATTVAGVSAQTAATAFALGKFAFDSATFAGGYIFACKP